MAIATPSPILESSPKKSAMKNSIGSAGNEKEWARAYAEYAVKDTANAAAKLGIQIRNGDSPANREERNAMPTTKVRIAKAQTPASAATNAKTMKRMSSVPKSIVRVCRL